MSICFFAYFEVPELFALGEGVIVDLSSFLEDEIGLHHQHQFPHFCHQLPSRADFADVVGLCIQRSLSDFVLNCSKKQSRVIRLLNWIQM